MRPADQKLTRYGLAAVALSLGPASVLAQELGGTVADWDRGQAEIFADSDGPMPEVIGTISDQGEVNLILPAPQSTPVTLAMLPCMKDDTVTVENADVQLFPLAQLVGVKSPGPFSPQSVIGEITLASNAALGAWVGNPRNRDAALGKTAMLVHVPEPATARGHCELDLSAIMMPTQTIALDYRLEPGWNVVVTEVTKLEDGKISATRQWTSSVKDLEMDWQFLER
ncbi:MAG: hypothetical protein V2I57_00585 [Xanthomonadales bacterium]|jgi:hypothetical protein|nr:hypothetical protein [Xanthomonadales bacterium]